MTDIAQRLRAAAGRYDIPHDMHDEAADEIVRLRERVAILHEQLEAPRIAAPDDEALFRYRVRCETLSAIAAIIQDHAMEADGVMDDIEADEAARAVLLALREAGALRHE